LIIVQLLFDKAAYELVFSISVPQSRPVCGFVGFPMAKNR